MYPSYGPVGSSPKKSKRLVWVAAAVAVILTAITVAVTVAILNNPQKTENATTASPSPSAEPQVASKEEVERNLTKLDENIKQAASDQARAKAAVKDDAAKAKVTN